MRRQLCSLAQAHQVIQKRFALFFRQAVGQTFKHQGFFFIGHCADVGAGDGHYLVADQQFSNLARCLHFCGYNYVHMKISAMLPVVALVVSGWTASYGQEQEPEVPGDQFSLEGALELFKQSESPEEFEKLLNSPDAKVNNLDLNGDGYIDYIRVHDRYEGNVHAFILQAVISEREMQDIAVIELEKLANGKAVLQIVGDEDIYGIETIIEPTREVRTYAGTTSSRTVVNVWAWPSVQYVYSPYYAGWVSPWGWHRRPVWWHTWRPVAYVHYHPIWRPYRHYYVPCQTRRVVYAHELYRPYRTTSVFVHDRHHRELAQYRTSRHDTPRSGSDRYRSGYTNERSGMEHRGRDLDARRNSSLQREAVTSDRLNPRQRNSDGDSRNPAIIRRDEFSNRRTNTAENQREVRSQVTSPDLAPGHRSNENRNQQEHEVARRRSVPAAEMQQRRQETRPRNVPADVQPDYHRSQRDQSAYRRPSTVQGNREVRPQVPSPATNRNRSSGSQTVQRSSSDRPHVQQRSSAGTRPSRSAEMKRGRD